MINLETRELRQFIAVAEELQITRAALRLGIEQPPLTRTIRQLEHKLDAQLFDRKPRGVALTDAGQVLLREARVALDAVSAAALRTQRAGKPERPLLLVSKAGVSRELLQLLLDTCRREVGTSQIEDILCEVDEQARLLRNGQADVALMHHPFDDLAGFHTKPLQTEGQVAILPAWHPLALRDQLTLAEISDVKNLPIARWPRGKGQYPDGLGPEVHTQSQLAQLVALGKVLLVAPASTCARQWSEHIAVPLVDASQVTTVLAWPAQQSSPTMTLLLEAADKLRAKRSFQDE